MRVRAAKEKDIDQQKNLIQEIVELETSFIEPSVLPQLFANDATPESLAMNAYEQGGSFALFSDEGGIIETLAGLYNNGSANIDILLKGVDGGDIRIRRKDRSLNLNAFLTIVLTVQPSIIQNLGNRKAYLDNGTLERFLYVLPKSNLGFRTHDKPSIPSIITNAYSQKVKALLNLHAGLKAKNEYRLLRLSLKAYAAWSEFQKVIEYQLRPNERLSGCLGWGGKICGFTLRIAGLLHVAEHEQQSLTISENIMDNAIAVAYSLTDHALKAYGLMGLDESQEDAKIIFNWIVTNNKFQFSKSELYNAMRNKKLGRSQRLNKALNLLIERNLISPAQRLPTKKPTTVHCINPMILQRGG